MGSMLANLLATRQIVCLIIPEAAEYLRVSPRTVYRWLREGRPAGTDPEHWGL